MPDDLGSDPVTVKHLLAAVARAEHWLRAVRTGLEALPPDTVLDLGRADDDERKALEELQPFVAHC